MYKLSKLYKLSKALIASATLVSLRPLSAATPRDPTERATTARKVTATRTGRPPYCGNTQPAPAITDAVLDAEVRIGELMAEVPKAKGGQPYHEKSTTDSSVVSRKPTKTEVIREAGFTPKQVERFQTMAKHPEVV